MVETAVRAPSDDKRWRAVDARIRQLGRGPSALIEVLHAVQESFGYLDLDSLAYVAAALGVPLSTVYGVATFYSFFTLAPAGEHTCVVCTGTACHITGAPALLDAIGTGLGVRPGETTADGKLSLLTARCVGTCSLAPLMVIDGETHGRLRPADAVATLEKLSGTEEATERRARRHPTGLVPEGPVRRSARVCMAASCLSARSDEVLEQLVDGLTAAGVGDVAVKRVGCLGLCASGPLVEIAETGRLFERVTPDGTAPVVTALSSPDGEAVERTPFFTRQVRVVTENHGRVDPEDLDDALAHGAYEALEQVLSTKSPAEVIDEITRSGLRGRGGAGYPTGLKWRTVAKGSPGRKYVICNADEGDPGAFMDRSVLECDPHRVLEGMAIAAYAVGADHGYIYCRAEYPLALARLKAAVRAAERAKWLGTDIAESRFDFHVEVRVGAGAFVCGEETALIASVQGGRGTPVPRPPYPAASGLRGRPTLINNVETLASVAPIIRRGGDWYAAMGIGRSRGTKVFALAGRVVNTGIVEVPMGVTLREIVYDIGGGIVDGRPFKAVQTGGPSGGCLPESHLDLPVDYESLAEAGSIMGSGGMVVMDDTDCMVDVARYFMDFCRDESCGKCVPCRVGTTQLWMLLTAITEGRATLADLRQLEELSRMVSTTSLCGLGQTAPNPVFSTLRYFRDEYMAHVTEGICPAGVCPMAGAGAGGEAT